VCVLAAREREVKQAIARHVVQEARAALKQRPVLHAWHPTADLARQVASGRPAVRFF